MKDKTVLLSFVLIFAAASLVMAWQFIFPSYYILVDFDAAMGPKYIRQFTESFTQGVFYPRWMPENFKGYGSPSFLFYSPVFYLLSSLISLSGLDLPRSIAMADFLGLCLGGTYLFLLLRPSGEKTALLASVVYMLLPTRLLELYFLNTHAGKFGQFLMPMVLYYTGRLVSHPFTRRNLAGMAISYSALILSHIVTAYIFTPFILAYGLFHGKGRPIIENFLGLCIGLLGGILLSAFFFLPILLEGRYVQLGYCVSSSHFRDLLVFDFSPHAGAAFPMMIALRFSIMSEAAFAAAIYYLLWRSKTAPYDREAGFFLFACLFSVFMMSPASALLWAYVPGLPTVGYPARYSTIYSLFAAAWLGTTMGRFIKPAGRVGVITIVVAVTLILGITAVDGALMAKRVQFSVPYINSVTDKFEMMEYLPKAVTLDGLSALRPNDPLLSSTEQFSASIRKWGYIDRDFTVAVAHTARLRVKTFYFPGWRAWVDGKEVPLTAQEKTGAILMDVPPGRHDVRLKFTDTPPRTAGKVLSLLTIIALTLPSSTFFRTRKKEGSPPLTEGSFRG